MKRVTLDPLKTRPEVPLSVNPDVVDPLVDASRRASALDPVDPRVLGRVDVNAPCPQTPRWRVADPSPPDPKALDARVSALAEDIASALRWAGDSSEDEAGTALSPETRPFPAASPAYGENSESTAPKTRNAGSAGPIRFLERFPVVAPPAARGGATRHATSRTPSRAPDGLSYDAASRTWTREVFPTVQQRREADAVSEAPSSREDVFVLERWLDASVAATRETRVDQTDAFHEDARVRAGAPVAESSSPSVRRLSARARETCDAAIEAFCATFETIARDVFTECRDRAALLRRVWGFHATFSELRGAANAAPALSAATRDARAARASSRRAWAETEALRTSLDEANARALRAERARQKRLDASRVQIFALTKKLRDAVRASADARGASARACRRENELREAFHDARSRLVLAKRAARESAWRSIARRAASRRREEALRRAKRIVAETSRADAACDAAVCALVRDVAEAETVARLESANARLVAERGRRDALAKRVAALERGAAEASRAAEHAVASAQSAARDARREAIRWRDARDDARCMAREARSDSGNVRAALVAAELGLGEARRETDGLRERARVATARAESAETELSETRRALASADRERRARDEVLGRARSAAAARNAAVAGLRAEITVVEALDAADDRNGKNRDDDDDDDDDDRVLVSADVRLASVSNAAARLLRDARESKDSATRETFALETRLRHVAADAARSASAAARSSASLKACSAAREALDVKARALEHRLAKREAALRRADAETRDARRDASEVGRTLAVTKAAAATLEARVADRDARLAATTRRLERSEAQAIDAVLVELALETACDDARERLRAAGAARAAERDRLEAERAATRAREEKTRTRLEKMRRALRVARGARDALAKEAVELDLSRCAVADERDDALERASRLEEEAGACRRALADQKRRAERRRAARDAEAARESARLAETARAALAEHARAFASAERAVCAEREATRDVLLSAIAAHRDARGAARNARAEVEPVIAEVRRASRCRARRALVRAARRREAATQSDDAHSACGRRVWVSAKDP